MQGGKVDILNASELADTSWKSANSYILLRNSDLDKDASYLRLSLGEFFGQRSEALGCLGGGSDVKRVRILILRHNARTNNATTTKTTTKHYFGFVLVVCVVFFFL